MASLRQLRGPLLGRRLLLCPRPRPPPLLPTSFRHSCNSRSLFTSAPTKKRSSFRSLVARWALAGGLVYCYAQSDLFINEANFLQEDSTHAHTQDEGDRPPSLLPEKGGKLHHLTEEEGSASTAVESAGGPQGPGELEAEADQQGAFDPETGEINWDCPCLGGMAHGPCGEEFKTAFSCFVFSTEDPKGVDCIEKFRDMQGCFQKHPEVYGTDDDGEEGEEGEDDDEDATLETPDTKSLEEPPSPSTSPKVSPGSQAGSEESKPNAGHVDSGPKNSAIVDAEKEATNKKHD